MYVGTVSADTLYTGGVVYTRTTHTSEQHDMTRYNTYFPLDKTGHFWDIPQWRKTKQPNTTKARIHQLKEMYYSTK